MVVDVTVVLNVVVMELGGGGEAVTVEVCVPLTMDVDVWKTSTSLAQATEVGYTAGE